MYKALFVGSNPSIKAATLVPFCPTTKSGDTLRKWAADMGLEHYQFFNVSNLPTKGNRPLTKNEIMTNSSRLKTELQSDVLRAGKVVAVGKAAAVALTLLRIPFYEMPHPSGLNRQLNDPAYLAEKIKGLLKYLEAP